MALHPRDLTVQVRKYVSNDGNLKQAMEHLGAAIDLAGKKDIRTRALNDPDLEPLWAKISEI